MSVSVCVCLYLFLCAFCSDVVRKKTKDLKMFLQGRERVEIGMGGALLHRTFLFKIILGFQNVFINVWAHVSVDESFTCKSYILIW